MSIFAERTQNAWDLAQRIADTLDRIEECAGEALRQVQAQGDREQFARRAIAGTADAAGGCDLTYDVPVGLGVRLISAALSGSPAGAGVTAALYLGDPSNDANLIHVFNYNLQRFSSNFAEGEYVDSGGRITIRFAGQIVGQRCTANLKFVVENPTDPIVVH